MVRRAELAYASVFSNGEQVGEWTTYDRIYDQRYHFLIEFRDGKICAVREYLDTQHAHAVWFQRAGA